MPADRTPTSRADDSGDRRWLDALATRETTGGPHDLDRPRELLRRLGDPHHAYPALHVAGTKGKGSTCALLWTALERAGLRAGLTTSPHLVEPMERIRLGGREIGEDEFWQLVGRVRRAAEGLSPGYFEIMTAAAFLAFADASLDVAVVEVGLGGRLDATNLVRPAVTAITRLGLDHRDRLGPTRRHVAREKAGILKPGIPAVVAPGHPDALDEVAQRAMAVGARLRFVTAADVDGAPASSLPGPAQRENAAVAWCVLEELARERPDLAVDRATCESAFAAVSWRARLQLLRSNFGDGADVDVLLDVAHDEESVGALVRHLESGTAPRAVVFSCLADKDLDRMASLLGASSALRAATIHVPDLASPRRRPPDEVADRLRSCGLRVAVHPGGVAEALDAARREAAAAGSDGPLVVVFGSFVVAGDALRHLESRASS